MSIAFSYDVPGSPQIYAAVKAEIGPSVPEGLIAQLVLQVEHGLRHIMVWDTPEHWAQFRDARVEPAVAKVLAAARITAARETPVITTLDLVDVWTPASASQG
jgi:hypothetical protein